MLAGFYTYLHRRNDTGQVFYVGKGNGRRAWWNSQRSRWWKSIVEKSGGFSVEIAGPWLSEDEAFEHEKLLIRHFKSIGVTLCNMTDGGEGASGHIKSPETLAKIIPRLRAMAAAQRGVPMSAEHRKAMSFAAKGRPKSEEHKRKIGLAHKGRKAHPAFVRMVRQPKSEMTREKLRQAHLGRKASDEAKANMRAAQIGRTHSEETKRKISEGQRGKKRSAIAIHNMWVARWGKLNANT